MTCCWKSANFGGKVASVCAKKVLPSRQKIRHSGSRCSEGEVVVEQVPGVFLRLFDQHKSLNP